MQGMCCSELGKNTIFEAHRSVASILKEFGIHTGGAEAFKEIGGRIRLRGPKNKCSEEGYIQSNL